MFYENYKNIGILLSLYCKYRSFYVLFANFRNYLCLISRLQLHELLFPYLQIWNIYRNFLFKLYEYINFGIIGIC